MEATRALPAGLSGEISAGLDGFSLPYPTLDFMDDPLGAVPGEIHG